MWRLKIQGLGTMISRYSAGPQHALARRLYYDVPAAVLSGPGTSAGWTASRQLFDLQHRLRIFDRD